MTLGRLEPLLRASLVAVGLSLAAAHVVRADEAAPSRIAASGAEPCAQRGTGPQPITPTRSEDAGKHLPADSVTHHRLDLPGRTLCFTATAGSIRLSEGQNETADVAYVAYTLDGAEPGTRPVSFALNGGPGIASAWLQLGALGPWRIPMGKDLHPSSAPAVVGNADTWLDFTDLVFLDPVGAGYSRSLLGNDETRHRFWSVDGDIDSLAEVIWRWLGKNDRLVGPKYIVGESYGGFRGPRLAHELRTHWDVGVDGLVLLSPVLDFGRFNGGFNTLDWVARLPSFAAVERATKGPVSRDMLADVERYAAGDYLADLMAGVKDAAAVDRMSQRVAAITGLDPQFVRRLSGRVSAGAFQREFARKQGKIVSVYDATIAGDNPDPDAFFDRFADPVLEGWQAPLSNAMVDLYARQLGWKLDGTRYELINNTANRSWDWGRGEPEAITDLRSEIALDPHLRVLITHGLTDLVTPYFETKMLLDQIPAYGDPGRLRLAVYEGGHMHYANDATRRALREDARALIEGK